MAWNEERRAVRRRLFLVEKEAIIESLRKGFIGDEIYGQLIADVDARLLHLDETSQVDQNPAESGTEGS
jgi:hypothetical protein